MKPRYELLKDTEGKYRWRLVAGNGEVVAQSEAYSTKANAKRGIKDAQTASLESE